MLEREDMATILIWIRLPNLKLYLWSIQVMSKLASVAGKPLFIDKMTAKRKRIAYARMCVEIKAGDPLPEIITINGHNGLVIDQKVEYKWIPNSCKHCGVFGHLEAKCLRMQKVNNIGWSKKVIRSGEGNAKWEESR